MRIVIGLAVLSSFASSDVRHRPSSTQMPAALVARIDTHAARTSVDERYLSVALDVAHVVGARFWDRGEAAGVMGMDAGSRFDFESPPLRRLAAALAPAYLRIGGTDADRIRYDLAPGAEELPAPEGARGRVLGADDWNRMADFARAADLHIMFTLSAGRAARDRDGNWDPATARPLIEHARRRGDPVAVWELGNELNAFPLLHGHFLSAKRYAEDIARARTLLDELAPGARLAGPAVAFWPRLGEGRAFFHPFLRTGAHHIDIATWHYYPSQSYRCPVRTTRAHAGQLLSPRALDEFDHWARFVARTPRRSDGEQPSITHLPALWLGETGPAQCGGEPGFSDRFASSFWWLDQLGRLARHGQPVTIRQALAGGDYGLVDEQTHTPAPDYWASVLWRRLMGRRVLDAQRWLAHDTVRVYAHCTKEGAPGSVTVLVLNMNADATARLELPGLGGRAELYRLTADGPLAREVRLGDPMLGTLRTLAVDESGALPLLGPDRVPHTAGEITTGAALVLEPLSILFAVFPEAAAQACRP